MDFDHKIADVSETDQAREWRGTFGKEYNMRNEFTPAEVDALNQSQYGVSRTVLNSRFLKDIPRDASILEVGCNLGNQLLLLHQMGFISLHGIDIQSEVVKQAQARLPFANLAEGSALQIPYASGQFDLVFTSGVLIHIAPSDLLTAMREVHRCSKTWIWGAEYWAPTMTDVPYRGHRNLLWKTDYSQLYLRNFTNLELVLEEKLRYLNDGNVDTMFLLRRKGR